MILCAQEKKEGKKERGDEVTKIEVLGEEENNVEAENDLREVEEQEICRMTMDHFVNVVRGCACYHEHRLA